MTDRRPTDQEEEAPPPSSEDDWGLDESDFDQDVADKLPRPPV